MKNNKQECSHKLGKVKGVILLSKYMVKKYGFENAVRLIINRKKRIGRPPKQFILK